MKKTCLLLLPLLLTSCGSKTLENKYVLNSTNEDKYVYTCSIEYESGSLVLSRYSNSDDLSVYKKWEIGNYEITYTPRTPMLYDYGSYAIWVSGIIG